MKAIEKIVLPSLAEVVWKEVGGYQAGFRPGHSCHHNIAQLMQWQLEAKSNARHRDYFILFFDVAKAYDSVDRIKLGAMLKHCYRDRDDAHLLDVQLDMLHNTSLMLDEQHLIETGVGVP